ncbi:MAG: nucleoside triphosphate pyrophosphohydrolase [Polyangiaceae bacterium]|nr:nucleoside triphosphate pyrophosphohydrolase [Polyangiaceae bacterium]
MSRPFDLPSPPPLDEQRGESFARLVSLMQRLLADDGCPWDREQDIQSLKPYVLEEACEVMDAIEGGQAEELQEELGDLALQIAFLGELSRRAGDFGPDDVMHGICSKLVRRHPHVFAETELADSDEVAENWEAIKREEKQGRRLLAGIPNHLPALMRAQRLGEKVKRVGFDWPDSAGSRDKVSEELAELDEAIASGGKSEMASELGDLLFALGNLARHHGIDAEKALHGTTQRFVSRFSHVEDRVREAHGGWPVGDDGKPGPGLKLEEMDVYWDEAKGLERKRS